MLTRNGRNEFGGQYIKQGSIEFEIQVKRDNDKSVRRLCRVTLKVSQIGRKNLLTPTCSSVNNARRAM